MKPFRTIAVFVVGKFIFLKKHIKRRMSGKREQEQERASGRASKFAKHSTKMYFYVCLAYPSYTIIRLINYVSMCVYLRSGEKIHLAVR